MTTTDETPDQTTGGQNDRNEHERCGWGHRHGGRKKFLLIPVFIAAMVAVKSALVMVLWNYVVPDLFHGPELIYTQALALVVLAKLLVGFGGPRGGHWGRHGHHGGHWGRHLRHRWHNMTPEEREKLRTELRERFGHR